MMIASVPSVNNTCFQHKVLTKIHGPPSCKSLQNVSTELKANASSVPSTLIGGQNGHLGLLLSDARCINVPQAIPWVPPGDPGPFVPPVNGTGPQIEAQLATHGVASITHLKLVRPPTKPSLPNSSNQLIPSTSVPC
jgi:hypothetical protein